MKLFQGNKVVFDDGSVKPAAILVQDGIIVDILTGAQLPPPGDEYEEVVDAGDLYLTPGVVDSHVHVNEPGRTDWEGFYTATKAAAAGGITTIVDMPLNSIPSTVSVEALNIKTQEAQDKCYVDVAFWGGVVPNNQNELIPMVNQGAVGFKCFLIDSGVDEFPHVSDEDLHLALEQLQKTDSVLLFHAEHDVNCMHGEVEHKNDPNKQYSTFLASRPDEMEYQAIETVCAMCKQYNVRCHIVHLSTASALPLIRQTKQDGAPLTVETTHHYLSLNSENIPTGATEFKCMPPIRKSQNQTLLWEALRDGAIDMVVSDHSPCTPDLKLKEEGDFMRAWGGIASVQFGLSLFWTKCRSRGMGLKELLKFLCHNTSKLASLQNKKGSIKIGYDADFAIWDPDASFTIEESMIHHKNKLTPYINETLQGVVHRTIVRGATVYNNGVFSERCTGKLILPKTSSKMYSQ